MKILWWKIASNQDHIWRSFIINISTVLVLFFVGVFIGVFVRNKQLLQQEVLTRGESLFSSIVMSRRWNASHGGVFVEKRPGVESNPYLENPDIHTVDGKTYTKKNPALMTREISELAEKGDRFSFHITSLKLLNPHNRPDAFEEEALRSFEQGRQEATAKETRGDRVYFRYMGPLLVEASCLPCHGKQDYQIGQVRGGISVAFDVTDMESSMKWSGHLILVLSLVAGALMLGLIYGAIARLVRNLEEAHKQIEHMAITDALTELHNRRYLYTNLPLELARAIRYQRPLSVAMIDLDNFKMVNDRYGHLVGDRVLQNLAEVMRQTSRASDITVRYGGEEFAILMPETDADGALVVAERLRQSVAERTVATDQGDTIRVTISVGLAAMSHEELARQDSEEEIIKRADIALYHAKALGKNRVEQYAEA